MFRGYILQDLCVWFCLAPSDGDHVSGKAYQIRAMTVDLVNECPETFRRIIESRKVQVGYMNDLEIIESLGNILNIPYVFASFYLKIS